MKNFYNILGITKDATIEDIKKSYKLHASKLHPDKHNGDLFFENKVKEINEAYEILSDSEKRRNYDLLLNTKTISYDQSLKKKEALLKTKENELKIREKDLIKKEKELKIRLDSLKKKEQEIQKLKEELILKKMENDDSYLIIHAPQIKENVKNIFVKNWLKVVGEPVKKGDIIVKIQSERAENVDIVSNIDGFLIYAVKVGSKIAVGGTLAIISK